MICWRILANLHVCDGLGSRGYGQMRLSFPFLNCYVALFLWLLWSRFPYRFLAFPFYLTLLHT
jgi:hypothetical protein